MSVVSYSDLVGQLTLVDPATGTVQKRGAYVCLCNVCAAVVINRTVHTAWHLAEAARIDEYITKSIQRVQVGD